MRKYGMTRSCVPNRDADKRRRNKAFFKGLDFADKSIDRYERKYEKRLQKEEEAYAH
jgi:hypothetical protein